MVWVTYDVKNKKLGQNEHHSLQFLLPRTRSVTWIRAASFISTLAKMRSINCITARTSFLTIFVRCVQRCKNSCRKVQNLLRLSERNFFGCQFRWGAIVSSSRRLLGLWCCHIFATCCLHHFPFKSQSVMVAVPSVPLMYQRGNCV